MPTKTATKLKTNNSGQKKTTAAPKKTTAKHPKDFRALVCAVDGECFWTTDGKILQNLADLELAFGSMDDEVFLHHVTNDKNDFADWVEFVLQDISCAQALRKAKKLTQAQKAVAQQLRFYAV